MRQSFLPHVVGVDLRLASKDPQDNVSIAYNRRHTGLSPFPHDHCTVELCWEATIDGKTVEVCLEIEYPCNVDWPIIGRLRLAQPYSCRQESPISGERLKNPESWETECGDRVEPESAVGESDALLP